MQYFADKLKEGKYNSYNNNNNIFFYSCDLNNFILFILEDMWPFNSSHRCVGLISLTATVIVCTSILFIYLIHTGKKF